MAITIYQCDKCSRTIELVESDQQLALVNKCVITKLCKGVLKKSGNRSTGIVGKPTPIVEGLEDYEPKNRLYVHEQKLSTSIWRIKHGMKTNPSVYVYFNTVDSNGKRGYLQLDSDQYVVNLIDNDTITIEFANNSIGVAHLIAGSSVDIDPVISTSVELQQISANNILTIATPIIPNDAAVEIYNMSFVRTTDSAILTYPVSFAAHKYENSLALFNTPWRNTQLITWNSRIYRVRSIRVNTIVNAVGIENGAPFYFTDNPDIIILTSKAPYSDPIDISQFVITPDLLTNLNTTRLSNNELLVDNNIPFLYPPGIKLLKTVLE